MDWAVDRAVVQAGEDNTLKEPRKLDKKQKDRRNLHYKMICLTLKGFIRA
jgi:hypothetical protein